MAGGLLLLRDLFAFILSPDEKFNLLIPAFNYLLDVLTNFTTRQLPDTIVLRVFGVLSTLVLQNCLSAALMSSSVTALASTSMWK